MFSKYKDMAGNIIVIVLTNTDQLGDTGKKTGWYLPEVAHPYHVFTKAGYKVTFVTPKGGAAPMDPGSAEAFKDDPICQEFLKNADATKGVQNTLKPTEIDISSSKAIFYAGGHGPMFDLPSDTTVAKLCSQLYEKGGVVGAVCHGTVGLVPVKLSNGKALIDGQSVTSFTNAEEDAVALSSVMPFMLETRLKELGAKFTCADNWQTHVQESGRIVTGQNPASASATAEKILQVMQKA